mmetsp:Transcript_21324/g.63156  ORF Transcript_21324/g.63156 Transcript_21324/m.63156 type:complete len:237 (+) Transcript_21324:31-741(+)
MKIAALLATSQSVLLATSAFVPQLRPAPTGWRHGAPQMDFSFAVPSWFALPDAPPAEATELRDALVGGGELDRARIDELIDALAGRRVPFRQSLLGGGLWRASYTRGETPRWEKSRKALSFLENKAGQIYDVDGLRVVNYGEIVGQAAHFTAEGTFAAVSSPGNRCPKEFTVEIERGGLVLLGRPFLTTGISGPGYLRVLYIDEDIRIFESPNESPDRWEAAGLQVVQVRDGCWDA